MLLLILTLALGQELRNQNKHRRTHKDLEFTQVSADINNQKMIIEGIIQQVNQLALLVQRQNYFDDAIRQRPDELLRQIKSLSPQNNEEYKIVDSLKQQLGIISQSMQKEEQIFDCGDELVCEICQSSIYYQLDEDNWYMIGFEHGFKKEFQLLIDSARSALGSGDIILAFSSDNDICLQIFNTKQAVDIENILKLYLNTKLSDYSNRLFQLPTHSTPQQFSVRATYANKQFTYRQIMFSVIDQNPRDILGGRLNKLQFSIFDQSVNIQYEGQFFSQQQIFPFQFKTTKGIEQIEEINLKYSKQIAEQYVQSIPDRHFTNLYISSAFNQNEIIFQVNFE